MSVSGIQGHLLEITVVGCNKLKDTEWISRQDPYVLVEYGSTKFRTRTCTDGGKNPTFQEKFVFTLIEGLREISVAVWNSNTLTYDDFIGSGKVQLQKVLSQGFDDAPWTLQTKSGRYAGDVRLIMHYSSASKHGPSSAPSAPPYTTPGAQQPTHYGAPPPQQSSHYGAPPPQQSSYYGATPPPTSSYPPAMAYPTASPYPSYPPNPAAYPPPPSSSHYPCPHQHSGYPQVYPPVTYPPQPYPPPPQGAPYYPPGPYPGAYPPPPPY